jgi:hypothetical protein
MKSGICDFVVFMQNENRASISFMRVDQHCIDIKSLYFPLLTSCVPPQQSRGAPRSEY